MELPLVLGGPILRKTDPSRVCIWIALSKRVDAKASLYRLQPRADLHSPISTETLDLIGVSIAEGSRPETVQLGDNLFVTLLAVKPLEELFPTDTLLFYDLLIDGKTLTDLGLTDSDKGIVYENIPLPCFFIPGEIVTLLHGSCRKPHATVEQTGRIRKPEEPNRDALAIADDELGNTIKDISYRPAVLFLTGDQIYADDVAGPLLFQIHELGKKLTGWEEKIPAESSAGLEFSGLKLYSRKDFVTDDVGFTSGEPLNHLLSFGEYAAMYLLVWNPDLWPDTMPAPESIPREYKGLYERERRAIEYFRNTLYKVRRVFANTPTYMIFDDHEITDDWNLNRKWYLRVRGSRSGRRVVSNGLAAYWAFQGWGNSPEAFSPRFISSISEHLLGKVQTGEKSERFDQRLWGFHRWSYYLPTTPPVIVPDSRTQREFDSDTGAPQLLDRYGIEWLRTAWADLSEPHHEDLILITSTPVYGFEPLENAQKILSSFGIPPQRYDRESWVANKEGFSALLLLLANEIRPKRCIILSGDVHYAFTTRAKFFSNTNTLHLAQLTSSAINNTPKESRVIKELGRLTERREYRLGWQPGAPRSLRLTRPALEFLVRYGFLKSRRSAMYYWTDEVESLPPVGEDSLLYPFNNIGLVSLNEDGAMEHCLLTGFASKPKIRFVLEASS